MSFVFLSHANPDKPRIRHLADALIGAGLKVWLDNPAGLGFSARQIEDHFIRLHAGGRYRDEIDDALNAAHAVLVCWSENAKTDRKIWHSEASVARTLKKLVACKVDGVDPTTLPDEHEHQQVAHVMPDLPEATLKTAVDNLITDVRNKMRDVAGRRLQENRPRDSFVPYLVDRTDQETLIGRAIEATAKPGGVRAFFVSGPENECPDEFLDRIERYTCPDCVGSAWWECRVEWPFKCAPERFAVEYRSRLAKLLKLPYDADLGAVAVALSRIDRPVAVISTMAAEEWQPDEPTRVKAWLAFWHTMAEASHRFSAIPILSMKMGVVPPGWTTCPSGRCPNATVSYIEIWREATRLAEGGGQRGLFSVFAAEPPKMAPFTAVPVLNSVKRGDADRWRNAHFDTMSPERRRLDEIVDRLFSVGPAAKHGVALRDFAKEMRDMFGEAG